jgi:hypothetical protein
MRATILILLAVSLALAASPVAEKAVSVAETDAITIPRMLSYQGKVTDNVGNPVADTTYSVLFSLYTVPSGGSSFWSETQTVRTSGGLFSVLLGSVTPIGALPDGGALYLGMKVGVDPEMIPRLRVASTAYAYLAERAANSDLVQGKDTNALDGRYVNEGQAAGGNLAGTYPDPTLAQQGATTGQVLKWTGSAWAPRNDSVGGGGGSGTVTSVSQATGVVCTPNPITATGTVGFDQTWGDGRYVNAAGDSMTGALAVQGELRVYGKGRIGPGNSNAGSAAFVAGEGNTASANYASVSGGADNTASGIYSHISGGGENRAAGDYSSVGGGVMNYASGGRSSVSGGSDNEAHGLYGAIVGGLLNTAGDAAADTCATVAGGRGNLATASFAVVGGGNYDSATAVFSAVLGGTRNVAADTGAFVGGGSRNLATARYAAVVGGRDGRAAASYSYVGGGAGNDAISAYATVGGGNGNYAAGYYSVVAGGHSNNTDSIYSTVGGGYLNRATNSGATVCGGAYNVASGYRATVCGGYSNEASGAYSFIPNGSRCDARGAYSFAGGISARANHSGSFAWGDSGNINDSIYSTGTNQWRVRARGGTWFYSNQAMTTGAYLAAGSNSWVSACDSATKEDFREVDRGELLQRVATLRVRNYKMKDQDDGTRHIGPVAQDFHAAFGYGETEKGINTADADGVLLAAVQALYERLRAQQTEIEALRAELKTRR